MLCLRYKRLLVPYMECGLDERRRAMVETHVSHCATCAAELEVIRSVSGAIRSAQAPAMEPAPDLWARVSARIEREALSPAPRPWIRVTQAASACAAAVLVATVGMSLMRAGAPIESARPVPPKHEQPIIARTPAESRSVEVEAPAAVRHRRSDGIAVSETKRAVVTEKVAPAPRVRSIAAAEQPRAKWYWADRRNGPKEHTTDRLAAAAEGPRGRVSGDKAVAFERVEAKDEIAKGTTVGGTYGLGVSEPARRALDKPAELARGVVAYAPAAPASASASLPKVALSLGDAAGSRVASAGTGTLESRGDRLSYYADADTDSSAAKAKVDNGESVVDALNKTEGVRIAALFSYP